MQQTKVFQKRTFQWAGQRQSREGSKSLPKRCSQNDIPEDCNICSSESLIWRSTEAHLKCNVWIKATYSTVCVLPGEADFDRWSTEGNVVYTKVDNSKCGLVRTNCCEKNHDDLCKSLQYLDWNWYCLQRSCSFVSLSIYLNMLFDVICCFWFVVV